MHKKAFDKDEIMSQLNKVFVFAEVFKKLDKDNLDITYDNVSNIIINTFPYLKDSLDYFKLYYDQYQTYSITALYANDKENSLNLPISLALLSYFKLIKHYNIVISSEGKIDPTPILFGHLTAEEVEKLDKDKVTLEMVYYRPDEKIIANGNYVNFIFSGITQTAIARKVDFSSWNEYKCKLLMDSLINEIIKLSGKEFDDLFSDTFVVESLKEAADANAYWESSLIKNQTNTVNELISEKVNFQELIKTAIKNIDISNELIPIIFERIIYDIQNQYVTFNNLKPVGIIKGKAYYQIIK